jgi:acyl-CoA thioester hydrolase
MNGNTKKRKRLATIEMDVRWGDMDAAGHLNNIIYFQFFEQARSCWLTEHGRPVVSRGDGLVIVNTSCTFLAPVTFPERVSIAMDSGPAGRSSFETYYEMRSASNPSILYAEGSAKIVWVDRATGRSMPIPEDIRALLPVS